MNCPFNHETCEGACPLNELNHSGSCKLRWLEKLPIIAREQENLNDNIRKLIRQLEDLTYSVDKLNKKEDEVNNTTKSWEEASAEFDV